MRSVPASTDSSSAYLAMTPRSLREQALNIGTWLSRSIFASFLMSPPSRVRGRTVGLIGDVVTYCRRRTQPPPSYDDGDGRNGAEDEHERQDCAHRGEQAAARPRERVPPAQDAAHEAGPIVMRTSSRCRMPEGHVDRCERDLALQGREPSLQ